jgi:alpha-L-fucosidase 2
MQRLSVTGLRTVIVRICATLIAFAACGVPLGAYQASCPAPEGNPAGNYMIPGSLGDVKYRAGMALDAYAPAGLRRPAAVLIHGSQGDKSTHVTQLFEVLDRAGFAWFSINYRNLDDVRAAVAYIRCPGRFNISSRLVLIAEDTGAPLALRIAQEVQASGLVTFGARFDGATPAPRVPVVMFHGTADEESPPGPVEALCRSWDQCQFFSVQAGIHEFEDWHPDQWQWKEELAAWLRAGERGLWKDITYARPGGRDLRMDAFIPAGDGPFPAVVIAHGGGWEAGDKATYISPVLAPLARAGYAWFSVDYRLTPYVRNEEQLDDLREAIRYVRSHASLYHVDPNRIAILGESASGQMVAQVGAEKCPGCEVQAVVSFYGVYDFTRWSGDAENRPILDRVFGKWDAETLRKYSPLFHVRRDMPPLLLIQGTKDELHAGTIAYAERLKQAGARYELVLLDGAPHGMENWAGHAEWEYYKQRLVDWLNATLHK